MMPARMRILSYIANLDNRGLPKVRGMPKGSGTR